MLRFKGMRFSSDIILACLCWYVAYPLSYWHLEELMDECGMSVAGDCVAAQQPVRFDACSFRGDEHCSGPSFRVVTGCSRFEHRRLDFLT
jgi:hypothetical protein